MKDRVHVYQGRFTDRSPGIRSAGKLLPIGDRASTCLTERYPSAPPVVQKFLNFRRPDPGVRTIFYGKAQDPYIEKDMTHGMKTSSPLRVGSLINPQPKTLFQQKLLDKRESIYSSHKQAPLGKSHDQSNALPAYVDIKELTFGRQYKRDMTVRGLINPRKTFQEINEESKRGHELYVFTHNDYNVGEIKDRKYDSTKFNKDRRFGLETPHFNDGRTTRQTIQCEKAKSKEGANILSKRLVDFLERTQPQIGKVLDPNADTRTLPADHTFGLPVDAEKYGLGDMLHNRSEKYFLRGKDKQRANLASIREDLKKLNHTHFGSLLEAFRHYDKNKDGKIDKEELNTTCVEFGLDMDAQLLDSLFEYCDEDKDGVINFVEFANFLNWKDIMKMTKLEEQILTQGIKKVDETYSFKEKQGKKTTESLVKPGDLVLKQEGAREKTPRTLSKSEKQAPDFYHTSSAKINAVVGGPKPTCYHTFGIPTIRTDLSAPRIPILGDKYNYGDQGNVFALLNPSVFSWNMVYEKDLFKPRSKEEIAQLLRNTGFTVTEQNFEKLWNMASKMHPKGEVSVETIRNVLHSMDAVQPIDPNQA